MSRTEPPAPVMTSLGGGHGLYQTLQAARVAGASFINAVVTLSLIHI